MVNANKLKGKFVEKGFTVAQVAKGSGIALHTLYRRLNAPCKITIAEADALARFLNLNVIEATDIFFSQFVA